MPQYYFNRDDGRCCHRDNQGLELPDIEAARFQAILALGDAYERLRRGLVTSTELVVEVLNDQRASIFKARLAADITEL
jgi:hypothetical protein